MNIQGKAGKIFKRTNGTMGLPSIPAEFIRNLKLQGDEKVIPTANLKTNEITFKILKKGD